jgi:hypothetical protein
VSTEDIDKKDLDKRVRALTTLTKDDEIPVLAADFFDSEHPLPAVCALFLHQFLIYSPSCILSLFCLQLFDLFFHRVTNPFFLVLLFQREDLFRLFLFLLRPKPPRLRKARTKMMLKIRWKEPAQLHHLLLHTQKSLVLIRRGNALMNSFPQVPLLPRMWPGRLLLLKRMRKFLTSWTRESLLT